MNLSSIAIEQFNQTLSFIKDRREGERRAQAADKKARQRRRTAKQKDYNALVEAVRFLEAETDQRIFFYAKGLDGREGHYDENWESFKVLLRAPSKAVNRYKEIYIYCDNRISVKPYWFGSQSLDNIEDLLKKVGEYVAELVTE